MFVATGSIGVVGVLLANVYRYEIPGEDLDIQNFDTRKFVDVSGKKDVQVDNYLTIDYNKSMCHYYQHC